MAKTELNINNRIYYYFKTTMTDHDSGVKLEKFSPATVEYHQHIQEENVQWQDKEARMHGYTYSTRNA